MTTQRKNELTNRAREGTLTKPEQLELVRTLHEALNERLKLEIILMGLVARNGVTEEDGGQVKRMKLSLDGIQTMSDALDVESLGGQIVLTYRKGPS